MVWCPYIKITPHHTENMSQIPRHWWRFIIIWQSCCRLFFFALHRPLLSRFGIAHVYPILSVSRLHHAALFTWGRIWLRRNQENLAEEHWDLINKSQVNPEEKHCLKIASICVLYQIEMSYYTRVATVTPRLLIWFDPTPAVAAFLVSTIWSAWTCAFVVVNCSRARFVTAEVVPFLAYSYGATFSTTALK